MGIMPYFYIPPKRAKFLTHKRLSLRWIEKENVMYWYIYNGILLSHKNKWNNAIYSNMDGPRDYHNKWSKPDRERQISYDIAYL